VRSLRAFFVGAAAVAVFTGCEPCSGVSNCGTTQAVHVEGRIVDETGGGGVGNAQVTVTLRDGSVTTTRTDDDGLFDGTIGVDSAGRFAYDLLIVPPADSPFVIRNLACDVTTTIGDGCPLGRIVSRPYFSDFIRIAYRDADGEVVPNAAVTFRRKSGGAIYGKGVTGDSIRNSTEVGGYVVLFPFVYTTEVVPLIGDLTVKLPPPFDSTVVRDFEIRPRIGFFEPIPPYELQVGPALRSTLFFYRGSVDSPASGVKVTFTRTSGIAIGTTGVTGTTDAEGKVVLRPRPLARGQVTGSLLVEPPAPAPAFTITGVTLSTRDDDTAPLLLSRDLNLPSPSSRRSPQ
jgi:hypothetical protein